ncbi:arsenate resistance ArsH [Aureobasidium subglaciale]|nr:arsenate resistance ArsH [Aureobasidium subglaciale]
MSNNHVHGDLNNTEVMRETNFSMPDPAYDGKSLAIKEQDDDAKIRARYRPYITSPGVTSSDWIAKSELSTALKISEADMEATSGNRVKILVLYGSLRERCRSYSRLLAFECSRILFRLGADVRVYNPSDLPVKDDVQHQHPKVQELRELSKWSDGHVWVSPEQHGNLTAVFKNQIDWIPLSTGSVRPTQGRTLAIAQVSGGSQSFNTVNSLRILGRWMRMFVTPNQSSVPMAYTQFTDAQDPTDQDACFQAEGGSRLKPSGNRDRVVDVMEELFKYTLVIRQHFDLFGDRHSERKERETKRLREIEVTKKEEKAGQEGNATSMITANTVNGIDPSRLSTGYEEQEFNPIGILEPVEAADAFVRSVFRHHGLPENIVSGLGRQFGSTFWKTLCQRLKIRASYSTAYHPETDGQTENANGVMNRYLRAYFNYEANDWAQHLPLAEFAANNTASATTTVTPFLANSGQHPRVGFEPLATQNHATPVRTRVDGNNADNFVQKMERLTEDLRAEMLIAQALSEAQANRHRRPAYTYKEGDYAWLDAQNLRRARPAGKLDHVAEGPYRVSHVKENNPLVVTLELPPTMQVHPTFHASLLRPAAQDPLPGQRHEPPGPVLIEGEERYIVERILDSRIVQRRRQQPELQYLVRWAGYEDAKDNTWEPAKNIEHVRGVVRDFYRLHPEKPRLA